MLLTNCDFAIRIYKVKDEHGYLSCMSPHKLVYSNKEYYTCEALFQSLRFKGHPDVQQEIIEQKSPLAAKMKARKHRALLNRGKMWDESVDDISRMKFCLQLKLKQHPDLATLLDNTGNKLILEDCTSHPRESARFWGMVCRDGVWEGENILGKLWMEIREENRKAGNND